MSNTCLTLTLVRHAQHIQLRNFFDTATILRIINVLQFLKFDMSLSPCCVPVSIDLLELTVGIASVHHVICHIYVSYFYLDKVATFSKVLWKL